MSFYAIAAMAENRVIGKEGRLPWHLPLEYRWFKHKTMGGTLLMGRVTYESIGRPLPGRTTVILTRRSLTVPGALVCADLAQIPETPNPHWVAGGTDIYRQLLPRCSLLYLTRIKQPVKGDAHFPEFEDRFRLNQVIHENRDFRVERWHNLDHPGPVPGLETWPLPEA